MAIKNQIIDSKTGEKASISSKDDYEYYTHNGLIVRTDPLRYFNNDPKFFLNSDYGDEIAQDASAGGTPEKVHNGIDDILWTGTNLNGTVDFSDAAQQHTGSYSLGFDAWNNVGNSCQITKGSSLDLSGYVSLSLWIYVDNNWNTGDSISLYGWNTTTSSIVGNKIYLEDYFSWSIKDVWHNIIIPLSEMSLNGQSIDAIRILKEAEDGKDVNFFIDDIEFEETGDPIEYDVEPDSETLLYIEGFHFTYVDAYAGTLLNNSMPMIPYNGFFGQPALSIGLQYKRIQYNEVQFSTNWKSHMDLMNQPGSEISGYGSDGVNSWVSITNRLICPIILDPRKHDRISITNSEDLSGLISFKVSTLSKSEICNC